LFYFSGAQKWEVFAQFWEGVGSCTSHLFIDNQLLISKVRKRKKVLRNLAVRQPVDKPAENK
jgi:hypothetical protein